MGALAAWPPTLLGRNPPGRQAAGKTQLLPDGGEGAGGPAIGLLQRLDTTQDLGGHLLGGDGHQLVESRRVDAQWRQGLSDAPGAHPELIGFLSQHRHELPGPVGIDVHEAGSTSGTRRLPASGEWRRYSGQAFHGARAAKMS